MNAHDGAGFAHLATGDAHAAVSRFRRALDLFPDHARSLVGLGTALRRDGDRAAADEAFSRATTAIESLRRGGRSGEAAIVEAFLLAVRDKRDEAVLALHRLLDKAESSFTGWTIPVEPLLDRLRGTAAFAGVLSKLAERAALVRQLGFSLPSAPLQDFSPVRARSSGAWTPRRFPPAGSTAAPTGDPRRPACVVNDIHSRLNSTTVARIIRPRAAGELQELVAAAAGAGQALSICGGRHAMGGQQFGTGSTLVDMTGLNRVDRRRRRARARDRRSRHRLGPADQPPAVDLRRPARGVGNHPEADRRRSPDARRRARRRTCTDAASGCVRSSPISSRSRCSTRPASRRSAAARPTRGCSRWRSAATDCSGR